MMREFRYTNLLWIVGLSCVVCLGATIIFTNIVIRNAEQEINILSKNSIRLTSVLDSLKTKLNNIPVAADTIKSPPLIVVKTRKIDTINSKVGVPLIVENPQQKQPEKKITAPITSEIHFKSHLKTAVEIDQFINILFVSLSLSGQNFNTVDVSIKSQDLTDNNEAVKNYPFELINYKKNKDSTFEVSLKEIRPQGLPLEDPANYDKHLSIVIKGSFNSVMIDCLFLWRDIAGRTKSASIKLPRN